MASRPGSPWNSRGCGASSSSGRPPSWTGTPRSAWSRSLSNLRPTRRTAGTAPTRPSGDSSGTRATISRTSLTIVLGYISLARDSVDDPVACVGLHRAVGAAGEIGRLIEFSRELEELGDRQPEARDLGSLIRTAADAANLGGIDHQIVIPQGTVTADPVVFSVLEHLFERLFQYSSASVPRPGAILVVASGTDPLILVYEDDASHGNRGSHPDRAFSRGLETGLAMIRDLLSLEGIDLQVTPDPLRVELRISGDRVWIAEK